MLCGTARPAFVSHSSAASPSALAEGLPSRCSARRFITTTTVVTPAAAKMTAPATEHPMTIALLASSMPSATTMTSSPILMSLTVTEMTYVPSASGRKVKE